MAQLVDWDLAAVTARTFGKGGPDVSLAEATEVVAQLRELAQEATAHVSSFAKMTSQVEHRPVRVVDRADWAAANIAGLRRVITPLAARLTKGREPSALAASVGSRVTGVQAGTVLAYMSGKVLGQFEVFSADPGELLLVAPNIVEVERKLGAQPRDFRLWVCLHEVTHRAQFTAVPWMRDYFLSEVQAFIDASQADADQLGDRLRQGLSALVDAVRDRDSRASVLDLVQTPAQKAVVDRLTALGTLLEGHAEFVMDGVGPEVVPTVADIREKFNERRHAHNPVERVLRRLIGIEAKMQQYLRGHQFVSYVAGKVGIDRFNMVWESAATLPRFDEISDPDAWIARVVGV